MDNIVVKKIYDEDDLIELTVIVYSEYVTANQSCYIQGKDLVNNAEKIAGYFSNPQKDCYVEFGKIEGNYTPAFSLKFLSADVRGHLKIEVDMEIADNDERKHRCSCYVNCTLGAVDRFAYSMKGLVLSEKGMEFRLYD